MDKTSRRLQIGCGILLILMALTSVVQQIINSGASTLTFASICTPLTYLLLAVYCMIPSRHGWRNIFFFVGFGALLILFLISTFTSLKYVISYGEPAYLVTIALNFTLTFFPFWMLLLKLIRKTAVSVMALFAFNISIGCYMLSPVGLVANLVTYFKMGYPHHVILTFASALIFAFITTFLMIAIIILFWLSESLPAFFPVKKTPAAPSVQ